MAHGQRWCSGDHNSTEGEPPLLSLIAFIFLPHISLMPADAAMGISILSSTAAMDPDVVVRQISSMAFS